MAGPLAPDAHPGHDGRRGAADLDRPWVTVVWNDPVNLMTYVTFVLQELFGYDEADGDEADAPGAPRGQGDRQLRARGSGWSTTPAGCTPTGCGPATSGTHEAVPRRGGRRRGPPRPRRGRHRRAAARPAGAAARRRRRRRRPATRCWPGCCPTGTGATPRLAADYRELTESSLRSGKADDLADRAGRAARRRGRGAPRPRPGRGVAAQHATTCGWRWAPGWTSPRTPSRRTTSPTRRASSWPSTTGSPRCRGRSSTRWPPVAPAEGEQHQQRRAAGRGRRTRRPAPCSVARP